MTDINQWDHKDEWRRYGDRFLVTVTRHKVFVSSKNTDDGPHRWAVYAYIYPGHSIFNKFDGPHMWQPAAIDLPLHGGPTFLRWHLTDDAGRPSSIQVGADYNHLHDERFTFFASPDDAVEVFQDAAALYDYLSRDRGNQT